MTTIVWDGKTLASDSQMTVGHSMIALSEHQKIFTPNPEKEYWEANGQRVVAFAVSGDAKSIDYIKHELHQGITFRTQVEVEDELAFQAILVTENHMVYDWVVDTNKEKRNTWSSLIPINGPTAKGSGGRFALAIVSVGKDAKTAVKATIKLDAFTGGSIQEFIPEPAPALPSVRPEHLKPVVVEKPPAEEKEKGKGYKGKKEAADTVL